MEMELSGYLRNEESVLCETSAMLDRGFDADTKGDLACTDSRLVFSDGKGVTDIRLRGITELVTRPPTYLNRYAGWAALFLIATVFARLIMPNISEVADFTAPATVILLLLVIVEIALAIYYAKWTVVVKTAQSEYRFLSSDSAIQNVPHAVRGAE